MKRIGISILIFILTCLFCVCLYIYFSPPLINQDTSIQSFNELIKLSRKRLMISELISLGAILIAKLIIFIINYCVRFFPMYEQHIDYYLKLGKSLRYLQWIMNGFVLVKLMSLLFN